MKDHAWKAANTEPGMEAVRSKHKHQEEGDGGQTLPLPTSCATWGQTCYPLNLGFLMN